jgi:hypothetical protein
MITYLVLCLIGSDFMISESIQDQSYPVVEFAHNQYYVFWYDMRHYSPDRSIYAARVTENGMVIDPQGRPVLIDRNMRVAAACDGVNFLAVIQDSC